MSAEDRPFIEEVLNGDRSEPVRLKAKHLLFLVPASEERQEVIREIAGAFEIRRPAISFMRRTLVLRSKDRTPVERAVGARVTLDELAQELRLSRSEMLGMIPVDNAGVVWVLLELAAASREGNAFADIVRANAAVDWPTIIDTADGCGFSLPERRSIVRAMREFGDSIYTPDDWVRLRTFNGGPLTAQQASMILGSKVIEGLSVFHKPEESNFARWSGWPHVESLAGLMPLSAVPAFRRAVASHYAEVSTMIGLYLDVVEAADRDARRSGIVPHYEEQE